jgi:hypothetical protein
MLNRSAHVNWAEDFLPFAVERVRKSLSLASSKSAASLPMFKVRQLVEIQDNPLPPVLAVTTEYRMAQKVVDMLVKYLGKEELALFDAEMGCLDAVSEITSRERHLAVKARLAHQRYCGALRLKLNSIYRQRVSIYKLGECFCLPELTIQSTIDTSIALLDGELSSVTKQLHAILLEMAGANGECVYCKDGCFIVENKVEKYRLRFALEGMGKYPMHLAWLEDGEVKLELLHRMGVYKARKSIEKLASDWSQIPAEEEYIRSRLYFGEAFFTRGDWRNPADRFVDSYRLSCMFKKNDLDLIYGRHPLHSSSDFRFCESEDAVSGWDSWKETSEFLLPEELVAPLLGLIETVIPYYRNYYFNTLHVRREEVEQILAKYKELRPIIMKNPLDESLGAITEWLMRSCFAMHFSASVGEDWKEQTKAVLHSRRREIVALYDFFAWWLTAQRQIPDYGYDGFRIEGP